MIQLTKLDSAPEILHCIVATAQILPQLFRLNDNDLYYVLNFGIRCFDALFPSCDHKLKSGLKSSVVQQRRKLLKLLLDFSPALVFHNFIISVSVRPLTRFNVSAN